MKMCNPICVQRPKQNNQISFNTNNFIGRGNLKTNKKCKPKKFYHLQQIFVLIDLHIKMFGVIVSNKRFICVFNVNCEL